MFHVFMVEAPGTAPGSSLLSTSSVLFIPLLYHKMHDKYTINLAAGVGLEPTSVSAHEKQSCVFTDFTTQQYVSMDRRIFRGQQSFLSCLFLHRREERSQTLRTLLVLLLLDLYQIDQTISYYTHHQ